MSPILKAALAALLTVAAVNPARSEEAVPPQLTIGYERRRQGRRQRRRLQRHS